MQLGLVWTDEQVDAAFAVDVGRFEAAVRGGVNVLLKQYQFDSLVSFSYNVGTGALLSSALLRCVNAGDFTAAAAQFDRWHIPPEVTSRRNAEREQFRGTAFEARIP